MLQSNLEKTNLSYERQSPSPDGNGILFLFPLKRKRYSGQLDKAP
ncbi:hypothetical protein CLU83_2610 [Flavobacterium sp. 1]|nr:hypothetical protein [Flavobacterium sp. 1]PJJ09268.1 hypothetical protein CLU83_2610 [Flavobacterium sp. 1]